MKRFLIAAFAVLFTLILCSCEAKTEGQSYAMDTFLTQELYGTRSAEAVSLNEKTVLEIENAVSSYLPSSPVCILNKEGKGDIDGISKELFELALSADAETGGAFCPALGNLIDLWDIDGGNSDVPDPEAIGSALAVSDPGLIEYSDGKVDLGGTKIDLGGITKGYALDRMAENCSELGISSGLIDFGGSIAAIGEKPGGGSWTVGIKDPNEEGGIVATVKLTDAFVSTSGIYERFFESGGKIYHHILDPSTGYPADNGLAGVSVVSESGLLTDEMSTALFVMGIDKGLDYAEKNGIAAVFITTDGTVTLTSHMEDFRFEEYEQ